VLAKQVHIRRRDTNLDYRSVLDAMRLTPMQRCAPPNPDVNPNSNLEAHLHREHRAFDADAAVCSIS
jgi:hypothetical protein